MSPDFPVIFPLYPNLTQLDFTGPYEVFARLPGARCVLASVEGGTLRADGGMLFAGLHPLAQLDACALLCVPGGLGSIAALGDRQYLGELRRLARSARYVTSVCTGSLLLGAAGLLTGRRAACHWAWRDALVAFGAVPDAARVVRDGNILTGGGVTAGIDLALTVLAEIAGRDYAEAVQLAIEYAPAPPFDAGSPENARPAVRAAALARSEAVRIERERAVRQAAASLRDWEL